MAVPVATDAASGTLPDEVYGTASTVGDSFSVAGWTFISRATGVLRVIMIGAVLGPTVFGNTYQYTNSLPNLVYYGFLAGSLFSSLLVPTLVHHIDNGDRAGSARVAGGFLGAAIVGLLVLAPIAIVVAPFLLRASGGAAGASQAGIARWLVVMVMPQVFCYAAIATCVAVMNARRRFALASAAPAIENIGTIVVLGLAALLFPGRPGRTVPTAELLLLGLGSTGAVALHAMVQWWGARHSGITLRPRLGWRDDEVVAVLHRAGPALLQAGLLAAQSLALLTIANRVAGGVVAMQVALNFFFLPVALAATPVALSMLPRLSRLHQAGERGLFQDGCTHALSFAIFLAVPAAVAYLVLAGPIAGVVAAGRMATPHGLLLISAALASIAIGVVGQSAFLVGTYASYARQDTALPLRSMTVQAVTFAAGASVATTLHGRQVLLALGAAYSLATLVGAVHLAGRLFRDMPSAARHAGVSLARIAAAAVVMGATCVVVRMATRGLLVGRADALLGVALPLTAGLLAFGAAAALLRTPELTWASGGLRSLGLRAAGAVPWR